jgi:hypothetical protein
MFICLSVFYVVVQMVKDRITTEACILYTDILAVRTRVIPSTVDGSIFHATTTSFYLQKKLKLCVQSKSIKRFRSSVKQSGSSESDTAKMGLL